MIPQVTLLTVIGLVLALALWFVQWRTSKDAEKQKEMDDEDKKIDTFSGADDIMRDSK